MAHGRWGVDQQYPNALIWLKTVGDAEGAMIYEEADFRRVLNRIESSSAELSRFFSDTILPRLKARAEAFVGHIVASQQGENSNESV